MYTKNDQKVSKSNQAEESKSCIFMAVENFAETSFLGECARVHKRTYERDRTE